MGSQLGLQTSQSAGLVGRLLFRADFGRNQVGQGEGVRGQLSGSASRVQFLMLVALAVNQPHWPPSVTGEKMSKVPYMAQQLVVSQ